MKPIEAMREVLKNPADHVRKLKAADGRKVVGFLCSYAPEEIILAAGAHPLRLFGTADQLRLAEAHLQSYCCSLVRGVLEEALTGRLAWLDGCVFPHTCDSIQRLSDLWRLNVAGRFHCDVALPVKLDTEGSRTYLIETLERFRRELGERLGVTITDERLREAIRITNRIRASLTRIDRLRAEHPERLAGSDLYTIVRAAMVMDRMRLATLLEEIAAELETRTEAPPPGSARKRVILSGGICSHPDVYRMIEEAGGAVVGDDLCTGSRYYGGQIDAEAEPIAGIADRYRKRVVCPAKHAGLTNRADHLLRLVREKRAAGVIFFLLKFCDPHAFDIPFLREALEREKIPSLLIEVEEKLPADGQLRTRFEAFIEMI